MNPRFTIVLSLLFLLLGLALFAPRVRSQSERGVVVEIHGLRSNHGRVLGALFGSSSSWAVEGRQVAVCASRIVARRAYCVLDVPPGTYAFACFHDENEDDTLNTNLFGLPDEGFGLSNDAPVRLGPPGWDDVRFAHEAPVTVITVRVRYGI